MEYVCGNDANPALHRCGCQGAPQFFCEGCFRLHLDSPQHRIPALTDEVMEASFICVQCNAAIAEMFCCCRDDLPALCAGCRVEHKNKEDVLHSLMDLGEREKVREEGCTKVRNKLMYLYAAGNRLRDSVEKVRKCKEDVLRRCELLKLAIEQAKESRTRELDELSIYMTKAIASSMSEVKEHLLDPTYIPSCDLARLIKGYHSLEDDQSLRLFDYKLGEELEDADPLIGVNSESRLSLDNRISPYWACICPQQVAVFHKDDVCLYTPATNSGRTLPLLSSIPEPNKASCVFLSHGRIFIAGFEIGDYKGRSDAFIVNQSSGAVQTLAAMLEPKYGTGLHAEANHVFMFGGRQGYIRSSCSKYYLSRDKWVSLPSMLNPRYFFNPCKHAALIYLIGGYTSESEVFSLTTEEYSPLLFALPKGDKTLSVVYFAAIVILREAGTVVFSLFDGSTIAKPSPGSLVTFSTPVIVRSTVYYFQPVIMHGIDGVLKVDLSTFERSEAFKISK